jgi:glutamate-1-semialdehyde 2,1-aminomutase
VSALTKSSILRRYAGKTPSSARRYSQARQLFPSGITHDSRYLEPHPLFVSHAAGARKWDVDGNEYVDYFGGHGALLLGHGHPAVVDAVARQVSRGVHLGASHDLELEWASLIRDMVPCAERVRFTVSGTEATHLALRVARAYTGKPNFVRLAGHFHGWHDHVAFGGGVGPLEYPAGILREIVDHAIVCPPDDLSSVESVLESRTDIAAVIVEPTGASFGLIPMHLEFLAGLRRLTEQHRVVLIFDEVITGFRCAPGGAQEFYEVTPDLTTLGKALAGGFPGAALAGRADLMQVMDFNGSRPLVPHQGTYNAGPVSAAAGIATLKIIRSSKIIETANLRAQAIRREMNAVIKKLGAPWCVYGDFSGFHIYPNRDREAVGEADIQAGKVDWRKLKSACPSGLAHKVRAGFLCGGVDVCSWPGGWVSGVHDEKAVDCTASAFEDLLKALAEEGDLD